ncbi:MAG: glycosyltransferase, partial [Nitrospiria bacterium]
PLPGEIIVTDNNSTDQTAAVARTHGASVVFEAKNQIARARNAGARRAQGEYLIFVDADTMISADLLKQALNNLREGNCVGGGALVSFDKKTGWAASLIIRFWQWVSIHCQLAAGSFVYCLRQAFEEAGGFSEALYAGEEIRLSWALKKWGKPRRQSFRIITDFPVRTSARKLDDPARVVLATLICILFPFSIYFKSLCGYWYKRDRASDTPAIKTKR